MSEETVGAERRHNRDHVWEGRRWVLLEECLLLCIFKTSSMSMLHLGHGEGDRI